MPALWTIAANPRKRRTRRNPKRARSAAQKAATRRMLAANRSRSGAAPKRRKSRRRTVAVSAPRRIVRRARSTARRSRSAARSFSMRGIGGGATSLLKTGAIGAGGALVSDVAMGFVNGFLPASMNSKLSVDGSPNYLNAAAKFGVTLLMRAVTSKVLSADTANRMAAGAVTVQAYELLRPMVAGVLPAGMGLGWFSPGMTFRAGAGQPGMIAGPPRNLSQYQNTGLGRFGAYQNVMPLNLRSPNAVAGNTRRMGAMDNA